MYFSLRIIRVIKARRRGWEGHVARIGENKNAYTILVAESEGKRPLERPRRKRGLDKSGQGQGQVVILVNKVTRFLVPKIRRIS
jgi:hypothetical protein